MKTSVNGKSNNGTYVGYKRRGSESSGPTMTTSNNNNHGNGTSNGSHESTPNGNSNHISNNNDATVSVAAQLSNKIKQENFQADREAFLSAFEKPTQIYRYMRTRMTHSPVFLPRTLVYMKDRMSRKHNSRKGFKTNDMLKKLEQKIEAELKEKRNSNNIIGKVSNQQTFYNIIFLGFSDPNHNWLPDSKAKVEMKIARICLKKRKEVNIPIKKAFEGSCEVKVTSTTLPNSDSIKSTPNNIKNGLKCPVISIPSECINLVNGHVVKSYVLMIKVSLCQSMLMKPQTGASGTPLNGINNTSKSLSLSPQTTTSQQQLLEIAKKSSATVSVKRLSLSNNSTLNTTSHNGTNSSSSCGSSSNETDGILNPKVVVVKKEVQVVGAGGGGTGDGDDYDKQPRTKRRRSLPPRDREQFIYPGVGGLSSNAFGLYTKDAFDDQVTFMGQITIYDKQLNIQLANSDYELLLSQSQKKKITFTRLMKQEAAWEILDSNHPKVQAFPDGNSSGEKAKLKLALRTSNVKLGQFVEPPVPLSSGSGKSKGNSNNCTDEDETENTTKVIYQFLYNNNSRQQTEARDDLRCPWCSLNCFKLYSLLKHLKLCHTRFHFAYVPVPNGARIDVSINELFDGSYTGSAYDLVAQPPGEAFARNGPTKRTKVFCLLVCRPPKFKPSLSEFLETEEKDSDQRRSYMTGHNRLYYHTTTCLPIHPKEIDVDSEGEPDPEWLQTKTSNMIDEFTDVNEGEKEVMKMWNLHVLKHNYVGDCQIPLACEKFVEYQGKELIRKNLYRNFILHLTSLYDFGLLPPQGLFNVVKKLQGQMKDNNTAGSLRDSWKAYNNCNNSTNTTCPNFGQFKFEPPLISY